MPSILLHFLPHYLASALYALLGFHFWRTRWAETDKPMVTAPMQPWERWAILGTMLIQGIGLYDGLFGTGEMRFSFSFALSLMLWLAVFIYWMESFKARMEGLQPMVLPLAAACAILPPLFPSAHVLPHADSVGFKLHFMAAMLAYSLFTLSALPKRASENSTPEPRAAVSRMKPTMIMRNSRASMVIKGGRLVRLLVRER